MRGARRLLEAVLATYLLLLLQTIAAGAADPAIALSGPLSTEQLQGHVDYLLDPEWSLGIGDVTRPERAAKFQPVTGHAPDFGYTKSMIWLRLAVRNESTEIREWRLLFRENFLQRFDVYQSRGAGGFVTLVSQNERSPFTSRPLGYPELVAPFVLPPGEQSVIFIRYWSGGSSELSFSIETARSFDAITVARTATNFIYYGMMLILVIIALMALVVVQRPIFLAYAGCPAARCCSSCTRRQRVQIPLAARPLFNGFASIAIGSGIILFGSVYSMLFLQTRRYHPLLDKLLGAMVAITLGLLASALVLDHQMLKKALVLVAFAAILLFVVAGLVAAQRRFKQVRFYIIAWSGAVISSAIMTGRHWLGIDISQEVQFNSMRIVMVSDAALMGLAIWDYFSQLRQARQRALQDSLRHAQQNLQLSRRLELLEQQYALAKRLSERRSGGSPTPFTTSTSRCTLRLNVGNLGTDGADRRAGSGSRRPSPIWRRSSPAISTGRPRRPTSTTRRNPPRTAPTRSASAPSCAASSRCSSPTPAPRACASAMSRRAPKPSASRWR